MKITFLRPMLLATGLCLLAPTTLWAHEGPTGHHGWLAGAAQPLLGLDHFLAALFVVVVVTLGVASVARWGQRLGSRPKP